MSGKINILGKGSGWEAAPHTELRWGINNLVEKCELDIIFNFHDLDRDNFRESYSESIRVINERGTRLIGLHKYESIPSSEAYPLLDIMQCFDTDYFANGICYMIAYALYTGKTHIDLYGVNMLSGYGYLTAERPCVEYWLGLAKGLGVECNIVNADSEVLRTSNTQIYGYGYAQMSALIKKGDENGSDKCIQ